MPESIVNPDSDDGPYPFKFLIFMKTDLSVHHTQHLLRLRKLGALNAVIGAICHIGFF